MRPLLFVPWGRDVIRDSWVANGLARIWAQGWAQIALEANATDINRNNGGEQLLKAPPEFTHLVMLDADHRHPPDTVVKLVRAAAEKPDAAMIVAINHRRRQPYDPCLWVERNGKVYQPVEWEPALIGPVYRTGLSACIIARWAFERVPRPWFANTYNVTDAGEVIYKREDLYWSDKLRKAGLEIWADGRIAASPHEPNLPGWVNQQWWSAYLKANPGIATERLEEN